MRDGEHDLTYQDLSNKIKQIAQGLSERGLEPGHHVIIAMDDCVDWPCIWLGCVYAGIVPLSVGITIGSELLEQMAQFIDCRLVIADQVIADKLGVQTPVILKSEIQTYYLLEGNIDHYDAHPDSACYMNISSGSTGLPKVAVHRHQTLFEIIRLSPLLSFGMTHDSTILSTPKMSWVYGLQNSVVYTTGLGATAIVIPGPPAASRIFEYLHKFQPEILISSPTVIRKMVTPAAKKFSFPDSVRHVNSSGEYLPPPLYDQFLERYNIRLNQVIGMMETCTNYAANSDFEHDPYTVGKAFPGCKVKLVDDEIWVSSPANAVYYYNNYDKTKQTFVGEWVRTGDRGYFNKQGNLVFAGRVDDVFKVNDLIVNPIEIESVIMQNSSVEQVAVTGVPNIHGVKEVVAFVVPGPEFDLEQLKDQLDKRLYKHQLPKQIQIIDSLPETITNKKDRRTLRMQHTNSIDK
jgi:benzoate-CoA ligase